VHGFELIVTLTGGLCAALLFGYVTQRAGLSPIVGYLLAGVVVGPHSPGFVADAAIAEQLAEVGVILLMFGVGLQFHVEELLAVRGVAIPGAIAQSAVATLLGAVIARGFGWSWPAGIVFGVSLAVASTVVLVRVLADNNALHTPAGHVAVGWLVVEDLFTVVALVVLPALLRPDGGGLAGTLGLTAVKVGVLVAVAALVGPRLIPRLLDHVARTRSRELFTLTVLVLALGLAVGSAAVFGVSMALGAFLAGLVVGRSDYALRAATEALPLRDAFAVLFFVSVGMLLDPVALLDTPWLLAGTLAVVLVGKPLAAFALVWLLRHPLSTGLAVSVALAQIGEFSFMLSRLGRELGLLGAEATNVIVGAAILSIVLNPALYRLVHPLERAIARQPRLHRLLDRSRPDEGTPLAPAPARRDAAYRAVVVGFGPSGRTVTRLLRENEIEPVVIELSVDGVRELRARGIQTVYGDATHSETLRRAGVERAAHLILTSARMTNVGEAIRAARELNPRIRVLARTAYLRDVDTLRRAGAETVFSAEAEVGLALTEAVLQRLGATPEQIDHERERVRQELRGG
jgi:CPA2 family monovalent cation:H+ antiporter-2